MFVHTNDTDDTDEQVNLGNYRVRTCARTRDFSENIRIMCIICYVPVVNTGCQLRHQLLLHRGVRLLPVLLPFLRSSFRFRIRILFHKLVVNRCKDTTTSLLLLPTGVLRVGTSV